MKRSNNHNRIISLLLVVMLILSTQIAVFADDIPANQDVATGTETQEVITDPCDISYELSGASDNMTATIKWTGVTDPDATYAVQLNGATAAKDITECSYKLKGLNSNSYYTIKVGVAVDRFVRWNNNETITLTPFTVPVATITSISKPKSNDNVVTMKWDIADIENCSKVKMVRNSTLSTLVNSLVTECTFHAAGGVNTYYIRAYSTEHPKVYSLSEGMDSSKIPSYLTYVRKSFTWRATFKKKATVYTTKTGTKKRTTCKKGTVAKAIGKYPAKLEDWTDPKRVEVELEDGRTGWVAYSAVKIKALINIKKDYAKSTKLEYVKNFDSDTNYLVWVNHYTMRVNIFKGKKGNWKLVRSKRVVVGEFKKPLAYGSNYSLGNRVGRVYRIYEDGRVYYFDKARGFHGSGYFHTRSIWEDTGKYRNSIGSKPNTRGCVRMYDEDAQYIWDLPMDTRVVLR